MRASLMNLKGVHTGLKWHFCVDASGLLKTIIEVHDHIIKTFSIIKIENFQSNMVW